MADNYSTVGTNALKLLGDGAAGVGPYTRFGTRQLAAIKVVSSAYDFTTTPAASNSNLFKAVNALQVSAELFYVGKPTASGANQFVAVLASNTEQDGTSTANDASWTDAEANILAALGGSGSVTISAVTLTGLSFA
jgi:hypothetical protein